MKKLDLNKKYYTKEELLYRLESKVNIGDFWADLVKKRKATSIKVSLYDQKDKEFWFNITDKIKSFIEYLENNAMRDLLKHSPIDIESNVIFETLIDEAFNSSVIEGAFSTRQRTKELVESGKEPQNKSEQMISNNYYALRYVLENLNKPFEENTILDIYNIVTRNTLDEKDIVDKYRNDFVGVWDRGIQRFTYEAPKHTKVQEMMDELIKFINSNTEIHPIIKACILHFYFVYIHPFFDGNGRTARAISYMYMLQSGYEFFKYFSISSMIQEERGKYYKAIENTEIYDSDMTYFIEYYLEMIIKSMDRVIDKFSKEFGVKAIFELFENRNIIFSERQSKLIKLIIKKSKNIVTIDEYKRKYKISYETARTDLNELVTLGILRKQKIGKKYVFTFKGVDEIIQGVQ